jgi:hypothetical protein
VGTVLPQAVSVASIAAFVDAAIKDAANPAGTTYVFPLLVFLINGYSKYKGFILAWLNPIWILP